MQAARIDLQEIIWEITGKCLNNCSYCGSKDIRHEEINESRILKIATEICKFPPKEIDISGGDPLLVSKKTHLAITKMFKSKGVKCKILANAHSIAKVRHNDSEALKILDYYEVVGLSVNTKEELGLAEDYYHDNMVVITNFNIVNIFLYEEIEKYVERHNSSWMIQFTMYHDDSELALYNNDKALEEFVKKVQNSLNKKIKIVMSDNITTGPCSAGSKSIGILSNGDVVPCLSMRSWVNDMESISQGNVLSNLLQDIWENKFSEYRFKEFKCCKDHCNNKTVSDKISMRITLPEIKLDLPKTWPTITYPQRTPNQTILYGVTPCQDGVMVYGVRPFGSEPISCAYLVRTFTESDTFLKPEDYIVGQITTTSSVDVFEDIQKDIDDGSSK